MRELLRRGDRLLRRYPSRFYGYCSRQCYQVRFNHKSFRRCRKWLGVPRTLEIAVCDPLRIRRRFKVSLRGVDLLVRTNWPDALVAVSCLGKGEYDSVKCDGPTVILDVGAYIGASAIYFALTYPSALVIAVEPETENYELLLQNTGRYTNIRTVRAAVWGNSGEMELRDTLTGPWGYTVCDTPNRTKKLQQKVPCITIGELMSQFQVKAISILKLDCEGAEKSILEHSGDWIDSVSVLTAELHEEIVAGCQQAFNLATRKFLHFEKTGEKVTAYNPASGCRT